MSRPPPSSNRTYPPFPYTTLFRSDQAEKADEIQRDRVEQIVGRHRRVGRIIIAGQHEAAVVETLLAIRIIGTDAQAADRSVELRGRLQAQRFQLVLDLRRVDEAVLAIGNRAARSEEHTSELQSLMRLSYALFFCK